MIQEPGEAEEPTGAASEGADSFMRDIPRENCPYPPGSDDREDWLRGWDQAAAGTAPPEPRG
jgi:ribosome modulation factor